MLIGVKVMDLYYEWGYHIKNWECDNPIHYPLTLTTIGFTFPVFDGIPRDFFMEVAKRWGYNRHMTHLRGGGHWRSQETCFGKHMEPWTYYPLVV